MGTSALESDRFVQITPDGSAGPPEDLMEIITYSEWKLKRTGEDIIWGRGVLFLDLIAPEQRGYELYEGVENTAWNEYDERLWVIVDEGVVNEDGTVPTLGNEDVVGFAIGEVYRKMLPGKSPDVTAIEVKP